MTVESGLRLDVRPAGPQDEETLLSWRNDPWITSQGLSQRTVARDEHHGWFRHSLERVLRELFIVEIEGVPSGMVRYDYDSPGEAEVSIYLLPPYPGQGYGRQIFFATAPDIFVKRGIERIRARVLRDNERSVRWFRGLGFRDIEGGGEDEPYTLVLERPDVAHSRPWVGDTEANAVAAVVASRQLAQGPRVLELEERWRDATGTEAAAAVGSGVAALRLALMALSVGSGDEVIVPAYSCVALFNAVLALGATPVSADVIDGQWTLSPDDVRSRLTHRTKAIVAVHLFGYPAPMAELVTIGLPVIEDCAHGIGGRCGNTPYGGAGVLSMASFYATKMVAGGEGGIVAGHNWDLIARVREARDYGDQPPDGRHLNDKMTDIEAALTLVQLDRLSENLDLRAKAALRYDERLRPLADRGLLILPTSPPGRIWYRYAVRLTRHLAAELTGKMAQHRVRAEQPVWDLRGTGAWSDNLQVTSLAFDRVLSLPLYPDLTELEQRLVCSALQVCLESSR